MARILILTAQHASTAPRVCKEADALAAAGHHVTVSGVWTDPVLAERDRRIAARSAWRLHPALDMSGPHIAHRLRRLGERGAARLARHRHARGRFSPALLGYGVRALLGFARRERADLTVAHSEGGLWICRRLMDEGLRVGVDFEDWFSADLAPEARVHRPIATLETLEGHLARHCTYVLATSEAMAGALAQAYGVPSPTVVYNTFPLAERESIDGRRLDREDDGAVSLHWFSQTLGPGRGLEVLFEALPRVTADVQVHVRGRIGGAARAPDWIPVRVRDRVRLHPTVHPDALLSRIAEHDVGLALESPAIRNRDLTATNKIFQYLQGGLAVIATATAGQREVLAQAPGAGLEIPPDDPVALAQAIDMLAGNPERLRAAKAAALEAMRTRLSWERHRDRVPARAEQALAVAASCASC